MAALLDEEPNNVEAHYALAVAERHQHKWRSALATLASVLKQRPNFGRGHQEVGYNYIAMRQFLSARAAFERAVTADPALINSWKCLVKLYREAPPAVGAGELDGKLAIAQEQIGFLETLPPELRAVTSYLSEDRLADAERLCKHFLRDNKTHVEGMRLLAEVATRKKVYDEAEFLLESCFEFEPQHKNARLQYIDILLRVQKFALACDHAERLLAEDPEDTETIRSLFAAACSGIGRNRDAIASYRLLMAKHPDNHFFPIALGHVYKADGDIDQAVSLYQSACRIKEDHGDAYWSLANTKSYVFSDDEVARMAAREADPATAETDRIQLCFAVGDALESQRDYERSFRYFERGNALKQATTSHRSAHLQMRIDSQIAVCTEALFAERRHVGFEAPDPIFVVGLPRAGSTLIEQILSSHSQVDGTMELHNVLNLAKRLRGRDPMTGPPRYPNTLADLDDSYFYRFGEQYINDTRAYRGKAPFFVDKMPNNFFHIGLIRLILPNAKVIDARRRPMACCFSGFKQLFGEGQEFSYGLREIGNYYQQYVKLMYHWDRVLPGFVLRVRYENVVDDLVAQVRRILDFCGLPFEQACVDYHRTARSIRTPSAEQVRQPIYRGGLEQWRNYERWLAPLKEALGKLAKQ